MFVYEIQAFAYSDFEHHILLHEKEFSKIEFRKMIEKARQKAQYEWTVRNGLMIPRPNAGFNGPAGYRKGGRVNGTTRYTLEPDERIWIDNNKAAHAKAAKLSDATIKLLLRALK